MSSDRQTPATAEPNSRPWHGIELRHLAALAAVIEEGSFHRAAKRLGYSQPAVSQQIAALERAVGHRLIDRGVGERATLTEVGSIVLRHARTIDNHLAAAQADVARLTSSSGGTLQVGVYSSAGAHLIPGILSHYTSSSPAVDVELTETVADLELFALLERGELQLAFVVLPTRPGPFQWAELLRDPYVLVVRNDSPLARGGRPPSLKDLASLPLISFRDCRNTNQVLESLKSTGEEPHVVFRSNDNGIVHGMVSAGLGVALLPSLATVPDDDLMILDLGGLFPPRVTGIAWHLERSLEPAAEAFVDIARRISRSFPRCSMAASAA